MSAASVARVKRLLDKYDKLPLECDGFTRVANSVLIKNHIRHHVYIGTVEYKGKVVPLHYWIVLLDGKGTIVDYRLRMWTDDDAPHGVFSCTNEAPGPIYRGVHTPMSTPRFIVDILTEGME